MTESRRPRRTKADIERCIREAAEELIVEKGFSSVLLTDITRKAEIEPMVFYNRYNNMDEFYDEFVRRYDYWLTDTIKNEATSEASKENCDAIINGLCNALTVDKIMLEILRWEVSSSNDLTNRTAMFREMQNMQLVLKYKKMFINEGSPIDIAAFSALMIGGIYYLFLHKDRSTFCGLDLNDPNHIQTLQKTISQLIDMVFKTVSSIE